jgi:hypothetical protein
MAGHRERRDCVRRVAWLFARQRGQRSGRASASPGLHPPQSVLPHLQRPRLRQLVHQSHLQLRQGPRLRLRRRQSLPLKSRQASAARIVLAKVCQIWSHVLGAGDALQLVRIADRVGGLDLAVLNIEGQRLHHLAAHPADDAG